MAARHLPCPHCGYDQSGAKAAWPAPNAPGATCPLEGTCAECGQAFHWGSLIDARRRDLAWLYEHTPGMWPGLIRAGRTWFRSILIIPFWDCIGRETRIVRWRLLLWPILLALSLQLLITVPHLWWLHENRTRLGFPIHWREQIYAVGYPFVGIRWATEYFRMEESSLVFGWAAFSWAVRWIVVALALIGLMVLFLRASRKAAKVAPWQVVRATIYSTSILLLWLGVAAIQEWERAIRGHFDPNFLVPPTIVGGLMDLAFPLAFVMSLFWLYAWWYYTLVHRFKFENARVIWMWCACISFLAGFFAALTNPPWSR